MEAIVSNPYESDSTTTVPGIKGTNSTTGSGVSGSSQDGFGVYGTSVDDNGVHSDSTNGDAVVGIARGKGKSGVLGISEGAFGADVTGMSAIAHGVNGTNGKGANDPPLLGVQNFLQASSLIIGKHRFHS